MFAPAGGAPRAHCSFTHRRRRARAPTDSSRTVLHAAAQIVFTTFALTDGLSVCVPSAHPIASVRCPLPHAPARAAHTRRHPPVASAIAAASCSPARVSHASHLASVCCLACRAASAWFACVVSPAPARSSRTPISFRPAHRAPDLEWLCARSEARSRVESAQLAPVARIDACCLSTRTFSVSTARVPARFIF